MKRFFQLAFLPTSIDLGLLVLRLGLGGLLLGLHGWSKLTGFSSQFDTFADPLGIGPRWSYLLATGGEVIGSLMVIFGLFTRLGALWAGSVMAVAFVLVHDAALVGPRNGELAMVYLVGFLVLLLSGGGRFSLDRKWGGA